VTETGLATPFVAKRAPDSKGTPKPLVVLLFIPPGARHKYEQGQGTVEFDRTLSLFQESKIVTLAFVRRLPVVVAERFVAQFKGFAVIGMIQRGDFCCLNACRLKQKGFRFPLFFCGF
jgi:hypothetical protein